MYNLQLITFIFNGLFLGYMAIKWSSGDFINKAIKMSNFILFVCAAFIVGKYQTHSEVLENSTLRTIIMIYSAIIGTLFGFFSRSSHWKATLFQIICGLALVSSIFYFLS
jgi:hypothetical protein